MIIKKAKKLILILLSLTVVSSFLSGCAIEKIEDPYSSEKGANTTAANSVTLRPEVTTDAVTDTDAESEAVTELESAPATSAPETTAAPSEDETPSYEDAGIFADVLLSKIQYTEDGIKYYLSDHDDGGDKTLTYTNYTTIDLDGDDKVECLIESAQFTKIFYQLENEIHGYTLSFSELNSLRKNGTFTHDVELDSEGDATALSRITGFTANGIETQQIWRIESVDNQEKYFVKGTLVTKENFDLTFKKYSSDPVEWKPL